MGGRGPETKQCALAGLCSHSFTLCPVGAGRKQEMGCFNQSRKGIGRERRCLLHHCTACRTQASKLGHPCSLLNLYHLFEPQHNDTLGKATRVLHAGNEVKWTELFISILKMTVKDDSKCFFFRLSSLSQKIN